MTIEDFDAQMGQVCANLTQANLTDVKCSAKNAKVVMSGKLSKTPGFRKEDGLFETLYVYEVEEIGGTSMKGIAQNASMAKSIGAEMKYIVEMPGEIVETNGKVEGNKVAFDIFDLASKNEMPYVKSKETKFGTILAIIIGIVVIIAVVIILMRRKQ
jgi:hypothetical protein